MYLTVRTSGMIEGFLELEGTDIWINVAYYDKESDRFREAASVHQKPVKRVLPETSCKVEPRHDDGERIRDQDARDSPASRSGPGTSS